MVGNELESSLNELDEIRKREASTTLRLNAKIAALTKQRDEMKNKFESSEKKYKNLKRMFGEASEHLKKPDPTQVVGNRLRKDDLDPERKKESKISSDELSSASSNEAQAKKAREIDVHARREAGILQRDRKTEDEPADNENLQEWMRATNSAIQEMQRCLAEVKGKLFEFSDKFESSLQIYDCEDNKDVKNCGTKQTNNQQQKQQQQQEEIPAHVCHNSTNLSKDTAKNSVQAKQWELDGLCSDEKVEDTSGKTEEIHEHAGFRGDVEECAGTPHEKHERREDGLLETHSLTWFLRQLAAHEIIVKTCCDPTLNGCKCACHSNVDRNNNATASSGYISEDASSPSMGSNPRWEKVCAGSNMQSHDGSVPECVLTCRRLGDWGLVGNDYVQRHIVTSSPIIATLRDLKPDEV